MLFFKKLNRKTFLTQTLLCTGLALFLAPAGWAKKEELPEVDSYGLHLVKGTKARVVYALPGVELDKYSKVKLLDCYVSFVKDYMQDYNRNQFGLDGRITNKDLDDIKTRLAADFRKEFTKVLTKKGHEVVDTDGPDVLLVRPAIINLDVAAPDTMSSAFTTTIVRSAGSMTLYVELYDSATSKLLVRVADPEQDDSGFAERANRVTNLAAANRAIEHWADLLSDQLAEAKEVKK
jgi:hypothetical protein